MSQTLNINNFESPNIVEPTKLNADSAIAAQTFTVDNNQAFAANDYFIIGRLGSERSDKLLVQSPSGSLTISSTTTANHAHSRFDPVTKIFGDQIQLYRASNVDGSQPDDSDFSALGIPVDIDFDQLYTSLTDSTGSSSYWYKFTYYNSVSGLETDIADSIAVRGGSIGNYASIDSIRREAGLDGNKWITDAQIDEKRQVAQDLINSTLTGVYTLPFTSPINPLIAECTRLLAAGYLLTGDYGPTATLNTNEGQQMLDRVTNDKGTGLLDRLNTKQLVLSDSAGTDTSIPGSAGGSNAWPNDTTADTAGCEGGGERMFRVSDISGNGGRY